VANVDGRASYAAIDHGRVFLLSGVGSEIVWLYAFDADTGTPLWGPVTLDYAVGMAEDDDVVFVVNLFGKVQAFAGGTGQQLWEAQLGFGSTQASPTAVGGRVYVAGAGQTTYALDEKSGAIVWSQYPSFVLQTPTIVGSSLLEGDGTARAISLDTNDGGIAWKFTGTQSGGSIDTTAAYGGRLYSPGESGGIFDQASGKLLGIFASDHVPAFGKQLVFYVQDPYVVAVDLASSKILWTFDPAVRVTLPPITIGDVVVVATEVGQIFVLDATSGKTLATDNIGTSIPPNFSGSLVGGLTAAGGMLFVGGDGRIVAY
jgi:outer membrane protein assembly factor BamB